MKKLFVSLVVALMSLCAYAGDNLAIGINVGVAPFVESGADVTNFGAGLKLQYTVSSSFRAELQGNYWFKSKGVSVFDATVNFHYLWNLSDSFRAYPLVGAGYGRISAGSSFNRVAANVGLGAEYDIAANVSLGIEAKYQYMKNFARLPVNIGIAFRF